MRAADGGVHNRDDLTKLCLERRVEIGAVLDSDEGGIRLSLEKTPMSLLFSNWRPTLWVKTSVRMLSMANIRAAMMRTSEGVEDVTRGTRHARCRSTRR